MCAMPERSSFTKWRQEELGGLCSQKCLAAESAAKELCCVPVAWLGSCGREILGGSLVIIQVQVMGRFGLCEGVLGGNVQFPLASTWILVLVSSPFPSPSILVLFLVLVLVKLK